MAKRKITKRRKARKAAPRKARKAAPRKAAKVGSRKATKTTKRRKMGAPSRKMKMQDKLLHGGAALAGGYVAPYVTDMLPIPKEYSTYVPAALGVVALMIDGRGPIGAAGLGMIGATGQMMQANAAAADVASGSSNSAAVRGSRQLREKVRSQMEGVARDRMVITGAEGQGKVITGNVMPSSYDRVRGSF